MSKINSEGLPMTAFLPLMTMGRSINFGFSTMASIIWSSVKVLFLNSVFQIASFFLTKSIGLIPNNSIIDCN